MVTRNAYRFFSRIRRPPRSTRTDTLFPYTTLFRSRPVHLAQGRNDAFGGPKNLPLCTVGFRPLSQGLEGDLQLRNPVCDGALVLRLSVNRDIVRQRRPARRQAGER